MSLYPTVEYSSVQQYQHAPLVLSGDDDHLQHRPLFAGSLQGQEEETQKMHDQEKAEEEEKKKKEKKKGCLTRCMEFFINDSPDSYVDSLLACNFLYRSLKFFPALLITFGIEMGNSAVLGNNQQVLEKHFTLVLFIPVISAIAGNVGLQTSSSVTAYINLRLAEARPVMVKFLLVKYFSHCIVQIVTLASLMGFIACFCYKSPCQYAYGIIIFCGALVNMSIAAFAGVWTPILLNKFGYDPSSGAGPLETALQDVVGAVFFVWFAKQILNAHWLPHCVL